MFDWNSADVRSLSLIPLINKSNLKHQLAHHRVWCNLNAYQLHEEKRLLRCM